MVKQLSKVQIAARCGRNTAGAVAVLSKFVSMNFRYLKRGLLLTLLLLLLKADPTTAQFSRGTQMNFGKNRVQYMDFLWTFHRFRNFDVYFYVGGQELAIYTGRTAGEEIEDLEKLLDYRINERFQFIVFNKLSDLRQTNIGLESDQNLNNTGGMTRIVGSKVLIYFDGDYRHFRQQIRAGVAQVMINQLMYGGSIKDRLQSSVLLNLQTWYTEGLVRYLSTGWDAADDEQIRQLTGPGGIQQFNKAVALDPVFVGHSFWNFVVETYGSTAISNLLYMTRINKNIESSFYSVLGSGMKDLSQSWLSYYQRRSEEDLKNRSLAATTSVLRFQKPGRIITQAKLSPDGNQIAWVSNQLGKYRIYVHDYREKKTKRISKGGYKSLSYSTDLSFPVIAWHPAGRLLSSVKEKKGKLWLDYYTFKGKGNPEKETAKFFYFEKVLDMSYNASGTEILLSAIQKGQSDLFTFNVRTRVIQQITKDRWDDMDARFVMGDRYIIFASTRPGDTLLTTSMTQAEDLHPPGKTDIFLYDFQNKSDRLLRMTSTVTAEERWPFMTDSSHFSYWSDRSGIQNRYLSTLDSTISYVDTAIHYRYILDEKPASDLNRSILHHDINFRQTHSVLLFRNGRGYEINRSYLTPADSSLTAPLRETYLGRKNSKVAQKKTSSPSQSGNPAIRLPEKLFEGKINTQGPDSVRMIRPDLSSGDFHFQSEFSPPPSEKPPVPAKAIAKNNETTADSLPAQPLLTVLENDSVPVLAASQKDTASYWVPSKRNYETLFASRFMMLQIDNSLLNETYQKYTGGGVYFDPGLNVLFALGAHDMFEDYRLIGGVRFAGNLNSNEYYLSWEALKHRMDHQITFYRQGREDITRQSYFKIHTHELKYSLSWPFSDLSAIKMHIAARADRTAILSTDILNLQEPTTYDYWGSTRLEYIHDNTISRGLNLWQGLRLKLFAEAYRQVDQNKTFMGVLGADIRHYLPLHRQIIWANRFATSTSFGDQKLVYYLGSTDNVFVPTDNFNYNIQVDETQNYAFQAIATNMRGFVQNIRNGNSFALINSEVRIPLFSYIFNKPIRSDFFRNFQVVGFGDIGTAWTGPTPYSKTNSLFRKEYPGNPISVVVTKDIEPIVAGYGFGLRSRILGYFLRADWAWGLDDGVKQKRIFYFSLGLDF